MNLFRRILRAIIISLSLSRFFFRNRVGSVTETVSWDIIDLTTANLPDFLITGGFEILERASTYSLRIFRGNYDSSDFSLSFFFYIVKPMISLNNNVVTHDFFHGFSGYCTLITAIIYVIASYKTHHITCECDKVVLSLRCNDFSFISNVSLFFFRYDSFKKGELYGTVVYILIYKRLRAIRYREN